MRCYECRSLIIVGMCSGHVHAYPNPPGHTLKGLRHLERASYMKINGEDQFGGCPNIYRNRSDGSGTFLGVSEIGFGHICMATELIGINRKCSVKLFNGKCSEIFLGKNYLI